MAQRSACVEKINVIAHSLGVEERSDLQDMDNPNRYHHCSSIFFYNVKILYLPVFPDSLIVMAETSNAPNATSATAPMTNTAPPLPPQRQSCDRCHRQKLRCTREKNCNGGGVCDRCLGKRVQCVYSFSLPKGRPSSFRRADESANRSTNGTKVSELGLEMIQRTVLCMAVACQISAAGTTISECTAESETAAADNENDVNTTTKMIIDTTGVGAPATNEHSVLADPINTSTGAPIGTWPQ